MEACRRLNLACIPSWQLPQLHRHAGTAAPRGTHPKQVAASKECSQLNNAVTRMEYVRMPAHGLFERRLQAGTRARTSMMRALAASKSSRSRAEVRVV